MKGRAISYSVAELKWIEAHCRDNRKEMCAAFNAKFERSISLQNMNALCKRKGWLTGRTGCFVKGQAPFNKGKKCPEGFGGRHPNSRKTQFAKGHEPANTKYLGHERVTVDGYIEVSVDRPNQHTGYARTYVLKHRHEWEKANGPIPDGFALKCLDGDKTNCAPSNWDAVPRGVLARLNGGRFRKTLPYDAAPKELKPTVLAVAKLKHQICGGAAK